MSPPLAAARKRAVAAVRTASLSHEALRRFGVEPARIRHIKSVLDTTFRVTAVDGTVFALRVSRADVVTMRSEMAWMSHLRDAGMTVPQPVASPARVNGHACTLVTWLDGRRSLASATTAQARALGCMLAELHGHARAFEPPSWFRRKTWNSHSMAGNYRPEEPQTLDGRLSKEEHELVESWESRIAAAYTTDPAEFGLITADLGLHNVLWHRGEARLFDFNDTGWGLFAYDLALTLQSLAARGDHEEACLEGYVSVTALPRAFGPAMRAACMIRMMRWRAWRPGGAEGERQVRALLARLRTLA